jgi:hypothetical protein
MPEGTRERQASPHDSHHATDTPENAYEAFFAPKAKAHIHRIPYTSTSSCWY